MVSNVKTIRDREHNFALNLLAFQHLLLADLMVPGLHMLDLQKDFFPVYSSLPKILTGVDFKCHQHT